MIAIDPGASGGIAYTDEDGIVRTMPMPEGMTEQIEAIQMLRAKGHLKAMMENVGFHMPGNSATATAKFARHCGHLEAACYAFGISVQYVAPQKWMREIGTFSKDKRERKAQIKEAMARLYPHLTVTLKTADALGIFTWAKK
jgi:hypothetical protein